MVIEAGVLAGWLARSVVAVALLVSAVWKAGHAGEFRAAVAAALPGRLGRLRPAVAVALPPLEVLLGVGLLAPGPAGRVSAVGAAVLLAAFVLTAARAADPEAGCGCWRTPAATPSPAATRSTDAGRRLRVARAALLLAAAAAGAALPGAPWPPAPLPLLLLLPAGALLAWAILELPGIGAGATRAARSARSAPARRPRRPRAAGGLDRRGFLRRGTQVTLAAVAAAVVSDVTGLWRRAGGTAAAQPASGLTVTGRPVGPSLAQVNAANQTLLGSASRVGQLAATPAVREVLSRRVVDDGTAGALPQAQTVVHDYATQQTLVLEAPLTDPAQVRVASAPPTVPLPPSDAEFARAVALVRREAAHLLVPGTTVYRAMPASTTRHGPDGRPRRVVPVGLTWRDGTRTMHRVVGADLGGSEVLEELDTLVMAVAAECGDPSDDGCERPSDPAGQAHVEIAGDDGMLWELDVVRPAASSAPSRSGLEIRDLRYRGQLVLRRAHTPIITVQYDPNDANCGPTYRDWGGDESCFRADGEDLATGIRSCDARPVTVMDEDLQDQGNFRGVAIYHEESSVVLVTELNAGWYRYVSEFRLHADGTIEPRFGFAAVRNPCTCNTHRHHAYWRLDFDLGETGSQRVEEINEPPLRPEWGSIIGLRHETRRVRDASRNRRWRIRNVEAGIGYELLPGAGDGTPDEFGAGDLWVLRHHPDELDDSAVATSDAAALDALATRGDSVLDTDVVVWYAVHQPHIAGQPHPDRLGPTLRPLQ